MKESLLNVLTYLKTMPHPTEHWIILILNEGIKRKDGHLIGKCRFIIIDAYNIEFIGDWELTKDEMQKFLAYVNSKDWLIELGNGICLLTSESCDIMAEALKQLIKYLIQKRYKKTI